MTKQKNTSDLHSALGISNILISALVVAVVGLCLLFVPTAIGLIAPWPEMFRTLGAVLLPSGIIGLIYDVFLRKALMGKIRSELREIIQSENKTVMQLASSGIDTVYPTFPGDEVAEEFAQSSKLVRVLQTWIPDLSHIERGILQASRRGAKAQILLLDPESAHCTHRGCDIGYPDELYVSKAIKANLGEMERFIVANGIVEAVEIRLYDSTPTISIYSCDRFSFIGWFWMAQQCVQGACLKINRKGEVLAPSFDAHFEALWEKSVPFAFSLSHQQLQKDS